MGKTPKYNQSVEPSKTPRTEIEPTNYKKLYVSWQVNRIDWDGPWGVQALKNDLPFSVSDSMLTSLPNVKDSFQNAIIELDKRSFRSLDHFLEQIESRSNDNITVGDLRQICKGFAENVFWTEIFPKLKEFEKKTWYEIESELYGNSQRKTKHHFIKVESLPKSSQKRLEEIGINDIEELFSLRLNGKIRLWGIRKFNYFQIIWIDPDHLVYPVGRG